MSRGLKSGAFAAFTVCVLSAQSSEHFEAAIVRPSGPKSTFQSAFKGSEFIATQTTLRNLIAMSYPDLQLEQISGGPSRVNSELWDLRAKLPAGHGTMQELTTYLACGSCPRLAADRPVTDKTGLSGYYDLTLDWARPEAPQDVPDVSLPSVFAALEEQPGLKLQPGKVLVDYLVIDRAERPPRN